MKIVGLMPVRNEEWCLGFTLRVALKWCDEMVLMLHECDDSSLEIANAVRAEVGDKIEFECVGGGWNEMEHRQAMLVAARFRKATHIAMIDADEFVTSNILEYMRPRVERLPPWHQAQAMLDLPGYNVREISAPGMTSFHSNGIWGNRWFPTAFRDHPAACWAGDQFHQRVPLGVKWRSHRPVRQGDGGVIHLWGASQRRLVAKHALYKVTERIRWPDKPVNRINEYYNLAIVPTEPWRYRVVPEHWTAGYADLLPHLHFDAEPWQVAEVQRLYREYGAEKFHGLDLFGVESW